MIFHVLSCLLLGAALVHGEKATNGIRKNFMTRHTKAMNKFNSMFKKVDGGVNAAAGDITTGWVYTTQYEKSNCGGDYVRKGGYVLGTCIPIDVGSVYYSATLDGNDGTVYRDWFSDSSDCTGIIGYTAIADFNTKKCVDSSKVAISTKSNYPSTLSNGILYLESTDDSCGLDYFFNFENLDGCFSDDEDDSFSSEMSCSGSKKLKVKTYSSGDCSGSSVEDEISLHYQCTVDPNADDNGADNDDLSIHLGYYSESCKEKESDDNDNDKDNDDDDDSICFSAYETVTTITGDQLAIAEVKVGDKILTVTETGELKFADVVFVPHAANNQISATFHTIETSTGRTLKATKDHLIEAGECGSRKSLLIIDSVSAGMCVMTVDGEERVVSNVMSKGHGVHTVITSESSGKIVVNGIIASSFGVNHAIGNIYYNIHRTIYSIFPSILKSMTGMMVNGILGEVVAKGVATF